MNKREKGCLGPPQKMATGATADWVGTLVPEMAHPAQNPSGYSHYNFQGFLADNGGVISGKHENRRKRAEMADDRAQWDGRTKTRYVGISA